jgi:hypothetical protein
MAITFRNFRSDGKSAVLQSSRRGGFRFKGFPPPRRHASVDDK